MIVVIPIVVVAMMVMAPIISVSAWFGIVIPATVTMIVTVFAVLAIMVIGDRTADDSTGNNCSAAVTGICLRHR